MASWAELYDDAAARLAWAILPLLFEPESPLIESDWIQRRVEDIAITSQRLVRRTVTMDLVLPGSRERRELQLDPNDLASPLVLPIARLRKEELIDFNLREGSTRLMLVRSALNARVAAALMVNVAFANGRSVEETEAALPWLRRIAGANRADAKLAFDQLFEDGNAPLAARMLAQDEATITLAEQLRDTYMMLIELPDTGVRRRLIQTATDQVVKDEKEQRRSPSNRLGLSATPIRLDIPGVSEAASYHAEVSVPPGCVLTSATVLDGAQEIPTGAHLIGRRATVYVSRPTSRDAKLQLEVSQERSFYLLPAAVIGTLICMVLTAGVAVAWAGGKPQSTASALLLSGLSTIAGLVIHRDDEPLTAELHGLSRGLLVSVCAAALGAAASIALGATGNTLAALWTAFLFVSVLATGILVAAAVRGTPVKSLDQEMTT